MGHVKPTAADLGCCALVPGYILFILFTFPMCAASMRQKVKNPYYKNCSCLATEHVGQGTGINMFSLTIEC